jgi:acetoin utilization deacetylase AcuC-like enzyme
MLLISSPRFAEHNTPPGHPERPERAEVFDRVADAYRATGGAVRDPRPATREELARVHTADYLDLIASTAGRATMLDEDTYTSPESHEIALLAAGAAIEAALHTWQHKEPALALVRPPGHHAEPDRARGFCPYTTVAVAAATLRARGLDRVAIVDIDVHHGNGTQAAFYTDASVLFISSHQYPYYPGSGAANEQGSGGGLGFTLNLPMAAGARDADVIGAYEAQALPALVTFKPDAMIISAGFDAHELDPLGGLRMTSQGYARLVGLLDATARSVCHRRIALVTEGGYHLDAVHECLESLIDVLAPAGR